MPQLPTDFFDPGCFPRWLSIVRNNQSARPCCRRLPAGYRSPAAATAPFCTGHRALFRPLGVQPSNKPEASQQVLSSLQPPSVSNPQERLCSRKNLTPFRPAIRPLLGRKLHPSKKGSGLRFDVRLRGPHQRRSAAGPLGPSPPVRTCGALHPRAPDSRCRKCSAVVIFWSPAKLFSPRFGEEGGRGWEALPGCGRIPSALCLAPERSSTARSPPGTLRWRAVQALGPAPAPRTGHVGLVHDRTMVVFGGFGLGPRETVLYADAHTFDFHSQVSGPHRPPPRCVDSAIV